MWEAKANNKRKRKKKRSFKLPKYFLQDAIFYGLILAIVLLTVFLFWFMFKNLWGGRI